MLVYIYTFPNGKKYVGLTSQTLNQRAKNGNGYKDQLVGKAIQKYGWDNIQKEIFECQTEFEMAALEQELIKKYNTQNPNFGYNLDSGGYTGKELSQETRNKISESQKGEKNSFYGHKHTEESKEKMRIASRRENLSEETRKKLKESHLGKKHSEETIKKMRDHSKNSKSVICLETKKIYGSCSEAARELNLSYSGGIGRVCDGKQKNCRWLSLGMVYKRYSLAIKKFL